jgi:membrane fusion protein (multidrug efflux system)
MERLLESIQSQKTALTSADEAGMSRAAEAEADFSRAEAVEQLATARLKRVEELVREEINSAQDLEQAESALRVAAANRRGASASIASKKSEWQTDMADRRAEIEELERQYGVLEGEVSTSESTTRRLGLEVGKRSLMAPVSGRLGDLVDLPVGSVVTEGQVLGSIVPVSDDLIVTAAFDPGQALGRIRPGQSARLRLVGYPWAEFGVVQATVSRVGSEVRDGKISVELSIEPDADSRIELGHGLPGTLEIQVEETSPSTLVLRSVGRLISRPVTATQ